MAKLNEKQKRFCEEYLVDLNATQAAIRAGYSEKTAYSMGQRLLKNVEVKTYVAGQIEKIRSERTADAQEVLEYLTSVMRGEHNEQVLRFVGDGVQAPINMSVSTRDRMKAAELIGKRYGIFNGTNDDTGMDDEEHKRLANVLSESAAAVWEETDDED